jgi:hypothetical protein
LKDALNDLILLPKSSCAIEDDLGAGLVEEEESIEIDISVEAAKESVSLVGKEREFLEGVGVMNLTRVTLPAGPAREQLLACLRSEKCQN